MLKKFVHRPLPFEAVQFDGTSKSAADLVELLKLPGMHYRAVTISTGLLASREVDPPISVLPGEWVVKYPDGTFAQMSPARLAQLAEPA